MGENVVDFFSSTAEEFASSYDKDPDFQERLALWKAELSRLAPGVKRAFDIGCGPGLYSFHLAQLGVEVTGLDAAEGMIRLCQERAAQQLIKNCTFRQATLPNLPSDLGMAELIVSSSVLEYVPEWEESLRAIHSHLVPGGAFVFSLPNAHSLYRRWERLRFSLTGKPDYYAYVKNILSEEECVERLRRCGFRREKISYYAHANKISRVGRVFLGEAFTENLFMGVFRKV